MSKNVMSNSKPLKGISISGNTAFFDTLQANNLVLSDTTIDGLMDGTQLVGMTIIDSAIQNTVIGANGPNEGHFTTLTSTSDITFLSLDGHVVTWDATNGIFTIIGDFNVNGCATIGNMLICKNDIRALNTNGDLNLISDGFGTIFLSGPVSNIVHSTGNYLTSLAHGNVTFIASDYINLTSQSSSSSITSFSDQTLTTVNGDITLNTETGYGPKLITKIYATGGNVAISTAQTSNVRIGDKITLSNTNSDPVLNGVYKVTNILNSNGFTISTGSTFTGLITNGTTGILLKDMTNNINLNASQYVKIPENIKLTFGNTDNSISGNTSGLIFNSLGGNVIFNTDSFLQIPQNTILQFGTSGSNNINFDGNNMNINSFNNIDLNGITTFINAPDLFIKDPNPMIGNYTQFNGDTSDKGIQFNYYSTSGNSSQLGWFGYKQSSGKFTLLTSATNSNEVFTGIAGKFDIGDISTTSITINSGSFIDVNCGNLLNVNTITGCGGTVNINANNVNITTGNRLSLISGGDVLIPNNIPLKFGTNGSFVRENTVGNLQLIGNKNILLNTQTSGSIILQPNIKLSFDGSSIGNQSILSDTFGNFNINTNKNINLATTSGNIIIAQNTSGNSLGFPSLQFGNSTESICGSTMGIFIQSNVGNINLSAKSNINILNSVGNIQVNALNGDIDLYSTNGNVRILQNSYLVCGISGTSNSIRSNSNGNMVIYGPNTIPTTGTIGNMIELKNAAVINLSAQNNINIPLTVPINLDTGIGNRFIVADSTSNILITNINSSSANILTSLNTIISNVGGSTNILNTNTNISTSTITISGATALINIPNVKIMDPILSLANYTLSSNDLKDRGIEYNYFSSGSMKLGWFGYKNNTGQFTFYSDAINTNEVMSGTMGQFALGSAIISNDITFVNAGNINMNCGTISNLNTITGCGGTVNIITSQNMNISSSNIFLTANSKILIPNNVPLAFGTTNNSINSDTNGNLFLTANGGSGTIILNSNVQINGTTNNVFSTITNIQDPIFSIGGVSGPILDDLKDRGIEFKWYGNRNGTTGSKTGFFGFQNSTQRFVYIPDDTNSNEIISGGTGDVQFANGYFNNLDVNCGTIGNVSVLTSCAGQGLNIINNSTSGNITISSANILIPFQSKIAFGTTSNSISTNSNGNLNINSIQNTTITSNTGGIIFNTNTNGNGFTQFSMNSPMYFGSQSSGNFLTRNTVGDFYITNTTGNIYISPNTSGGNVILPTNNNLVFGNTSTKITSDGSNLQLYGNSIGINSTSTITLNGDVNVVGSFTSIDTGKYIYPLGTKQLLNITSIVNSTTSGNILITTNAINYLIVGDTITLLNTNSTPIINSTFTINQIINNTTFSIPHTALSVSGNNGIMYGVLKVYQGKDVGIEVDYWSSVGNTSVTSGSSNFKQAFFGWINNTQQWSFYNTATIQNDIVTQGVLGDIKINELFANKISGFTLDGPIIGSTFTIAGSNFQISGGGIDNTPIGQTNAQTARFTSLSSTVNTSLENVSLQSNLNYSVERFTLSSLLQTCNPSTNTIISYINVNGATFVGTGTMGNTGLSDGQIKKLICSGMGNGCEYRLAFVSGKLLTPNPLNGSLPTRMTFKRVGQSVELMWDISSLAWILTGGSGVNIS